MQDMTWLQMDLHLTPADLAAACCAVTVALGSSTSRIWFDGTRGSLRLAVVS
jgi:hypothetical protein